MRPLTKKDMVAESVYNIVQALSPEELERFYSMLGVKKAELRKPNKRNDPLLTEKLIQRICKKKL